MTRPNSYDLRERVVRAHLAGEPIRSVAARYGLSVSSLPKWGACWRAPGSVVPDKIGGHRSWRLEPYRERVYALVGETPHLTIDRLQDLLGAHGISTRRDTIWRFLRRDRTSHSKDQALDARSPKSYRRSLPRPSRTAHRIYPTPRVPQLHSKRRIRFRLKQIRYRKRFSGVSG